MNTKTKQMLMMWLPKIWYSFVSLLVLSEAKKLPGFVGGYLFGGVLLYLLPKLASRIRFDGYASLKRSIERMDDRLPGGLVNWMTLAVFVVTRNFLVMAGYTLATVVFYFYPMIIPPILKILDTPDDRPEQN